MHSCREILDALEGYLDDALVAEMRRQVEAHLKSCRTCEVLYDTTRKTLRLVTDSGSFDIPSGLSERLLARLKAHRGGAGAC